MHLASHRAAGCSGLRPRSERNALHRCPHSCRPRARAAPAAGQAGLRHSGRTTAAAANHAAAAGAAAASATGANSNGRPLKQQQLIDIGATFVRLWFAGIAKGPQAVEQELSEVLDPAVAIMPDRVRLLDETQGFAEVLAELERSHLEYHRSEHRPMLYAASEEGQRVYALVEGVYQDVGALPGHPATFRVSKVHHILVLQVQGGRAVRLWLRRQMTEEDKDELLHDPLACYPSPFPRDSLRLTHAATHDAAGDKMADTISSWWRAWSTAPGAAAAAAAAAAAGAAPDQSASSSSSTTGGSPAARPARSKGPAGLSSAAQLLAANFRIFDAYGLYPAMRVQGRRHLNKDSAVQYLERLRYSHRQTIEIVNVAVAEGSLACFTHWQARLEPKWPAASAASSVGAAVGAAAVGAAAVEGAAQAATGAGHAGSNASSSTQQQQDQQQQQGPQQAVALLEPVDGTFTVDVMEVDIFNEQLQLQDIWMFRGPISHKEVQLFLEFDRQRAATEAAQAEAAQEDVRSARRAQREQQLHELLAWMRAYQQQWDESVAHVQKALARQQLPRQQLAKAQQLLQKLGDQGFVVPPPEQQQKQQQQVPTAVAAEGAAAAALAAASGAEAGQQQGDQGRAAASSGEEGGIDSSRT